MVDEDAWEAEAQSAFALRTVDSRAAVERADRVIAARGASAVARAIAHRTRALCAYDRHDRARARSSVRVALRWARSARRPDVLAGCLTTFAGVEFFSGNRRGALLALEEAGHVAPSIDVSYTRAWMLYMAGQWHEALDAHEVLLAGELNPQDRATTAANYALVLAELGRPDDAVAAADSIDHGEHDGSQLAITVAYVQAYCRSLAGRIPAALQAFDLLARRIDDQPAELAWVAEGHAGVLIAANLLDEAIQTSVAGIEAAGPAGPLELRAELWWRNAQAHAAKGNRTDAASSARTAERLFRRIGAPGRADLARLVALRSSDAPRHRRALAELATRFATDHRWSPAAEAAADVALSAAARDEVPSEQIRAVLADARSRVGSLARARAWLGLAADASVRGRPTEVRRATRRGLGALDDARQMLGSPELRVRAAAISDELLRFGLDVAITNGDAWDALDVIERARSRSILSRPVSSPEVATAIAALRRANNDPDATEDDRQSAETELRRTARRTVGDVADLVPRPLTRSELRHALADRSIASLVIHRNSLWSIVSDGRRATLDRVCDAEQLFAAAGEIRFAVSRLARANVSPAMARTLVANVRSATERLDDLLAPTVARLADRVVITPPAALADLPFHLIRGVAARSPVIAPTATWWSRRVGAPSARESVLAIHGDGLERSAAEAASIARCYGTARIESTVEQVAAALGTHDVAHFAAHGQLRADHPHLSSIRLADGPCTLYDLDDAGRMPATVVLAACEVAGGAEHPGDEILGFVGELFSLGTCNVVATRAALSDRVAPEFMTALHSRLSAGDTVTGALAAARSTLDPAVPDELATLYSVIGLGTGS